MYMPRFLDLFAGAGGLSEGFLRAGYEAVAHVEMDVAACYTLKTRMAYHWLKDHDQLDIYDQCPQDQLTIIMRRIMMRIAEKIAEKEGAIALVTGENLGQVASQTLQSLYCTNEVCTMPVFRPLIGFDKQEIIEIAQRIDTYETSILPYEDCCTIFVAKHPVTKPDLERIEKSETHLSEKIDEMFETAVTTREIIKVSPDSEE